MKRSYSDQPLAPADRDLGQTDLASFAKRITNDDISFAGKRIGWSYKVRTFKVAIIDVLRVDELEIR